VPAAVNLWKLLSIQRLMHRSTPTGSQMHFRFRCYRTPEYWVETIVMKRIAGIAQGYENLNDHDQPRLGPVLAVLTAGRQINAESIGAEPRRTDAVSQGQPRLGGRSAGGADPVQGQDRLRVLPLQTGWHIGRNCSYRRKPMRFSSNVVHFR
jgi:hypothetical protein